MQNANTAPALPAGLDPRSDYERSLEQYIIARRAEAQRRLADDWLLAHPVRRVAQ